VVKSRTVKYLVISGSFILLAGWQVAPLLAKQPPADNAIALGDDQDWSNCLRKHFEKRFFKRIDATKDQQEQLSALIENAAKENEGMRAEIREKALALVNSFGDGNDSDDHLRQQVAELRTLHEKLMDKRLETVLQIRAVMTPQQRKVVMDRIKLRLDGFFGKTILNQS
jgi:Spy/CpxP family protein refolding chaperone